MKTIFKLTLSFAALAFSSGLAALNDIPLAVTTLAHPSLLETPTAAQLKKSDNYLQRGLKALSRNETGRAIEEFRDSVKISPTSDNYKALGTSYYQSGDSAKAAWAYRQSLQLQPNAQVQALVDSLEGRDDPKESFKDEHDRLRYAKLLSEGKAFEKEGKLDTAFGRYKEANGILPGPEAREPMGRVGVAIVEKSVSGQNYAKGLEKVKELRSVYKNAKDTVKSEDQYLSRLDKAERALANAAGEKSRELEKATQSDKERFDRTMQEKGKGSKIKIQVE